VLQLDDKRFDRAFFERWMAEWDASSMIFLPRLREIALFDLSRAPERVADHALEAADTQDVKLPMPRALSAVRIHLKEVGGTRAWTVYRLRYPKRKNLKATNKAIGDEVTMAVAVAHQNEDTRLYAALPLEEPCSLPFSASAPFDVNVDRTRILDEKPLNEWLVARLVDLAASIARERLARRPREAWAWMVVPKETAGDDRSWLRGRFDVALTRARGGLERATLRLKDGTEQRLDELIVHSRHIDGLFTVDEIERLARETRPFWRRDSFVHRAVPTTARDSARWRQILWMIPKSHKLFAKNALAALDWPRNEVASAKPDWLPRLVVAGINAEVEEELWTKRWVALDGDTRVTPAEIRAGALLLVRALPEEGLASHLQIAAQIGSELRLRGDAASLSRQWLTDQGLLREKASDAEALRVLAEASREDPIDLSRDDAGLVRLRNVFEQLPAPDREALGPGLGRNIAVSGIQFDNRGAAEEIATRPCDAYMPSAIEKLDGWSTAAGRTTGLAWIDARYADVLRTGRDRKRQGALAFMRTLGAAVSPRLSSGHEPDSNPHASLPRRRLSDLQLEELSRLPKARTLIDDWESPDLMKVLTDIQEEKRVGERRRRARSLFLCLNRNWRLYEERATATAAHHYRTWYHDGPVSATWIGYLASTTWMSTQERAYSPKAPKHLAVLTAASIEIEGQNRARYAHEVLEEEADSPLVAALGMEGRPFAQTIIDRLVALRDAETAGEIVHQTWAESCYSAVAAYCPGGELAAQADLDPIELRAAFGRRPGEPGLIRVDRRWLSIPDVRTGDYLSDEVPRVARPERLWGTLGVAPAGVSDAIRLISDLARAGRHDEGVEIRALRLVLKHAGDRGFARKIARMPVRTHTGWRHDRRTPIYAIANPRLAEVVGRTWPVWDLPFGLHEAQPLIDPLGITVLGDEAFEPDVPSSLLGASDFESALPEHVTRLRNFLVREAPSLHDRVPPERWRCLSEARVVLGAGWRAKVRASKGKVLRVEVAAHFFAVAGLLAALDDDEATRMDNGGRAVAQFLLDSDASDQDRAFVALAWESQARRSDGGDVMLFAEDDVQEEDTAANPMPAWARRTSHRHRRRGKKPKGSKLKQDSVLRSLVDVEALDMESVSVLVVTTDREGKVRVEQKRTPKPPNRKRSSAAANRAFKSTAAARDYNDTEREDSGYRLAEAKLGETYGLTLDDLRDQPDVGADAFDQQNDVWVELKTHGQGRPDTVRLEPSQGERAREKGERYLLVIIWGLEAPNVPQMLIVPDPLRRLDTWLGRGIKLTGLAEL